MRIKGLCVPAVAVVCPRRYFGERREFGLEAPGVISEVAGHPLWGFTYELLMDWLRGRAESKGRSPMP